MKRHALIIVALLAVSVLALGLTAQAQQKRVPVKIEGKTVLPLRVLGPAFLQHL